MLKPPWMMKFRISASADVSSMELSSKALTKVSRADIIRSPASVKLLLMWNSLSISARKRLAVAVSYTGVRNTLKMKPRPPML